MLQWIYEQISMFNRSKMASIAVFNVMLLVSLASIISAADVLWKNQAMLDENGVYQVLWDWNDENVTFELQVQTKGWVGFGFSRDGTMVGADIIMGWVKEDGLHFQDRFAPVSKEPLIDQIQDYELLSGSENDTHTILQFQRKKDTGDDNDLPITNGTVRLIYAWNDKDPVEETGMESHHQNKGNKTVNLY